MAARFGASDLIDSHLGSGSPSTPQKRDTFKLVVLGDSGVGKTNLVKRFTTVRLCISHSCSDAAQNTFTHDSETTIGAAFQVHREPATDTTLQIWDTAGQERYAQLVPLYYRGAHGAILVYDITNRLSFERAKRWKVRFRILCTTILPFAG